MLFIERVKEEDEGLYQCIATNLKGSVESTAYVTVQGKARHGVGRASQRDALAVPGRDGEWVGQHVASSESSNLKEVLARETYQVGKEAQQEMLTQSVFTLT